MSVHGKSKIRAYVANGLDATNLEPSTNTVVDRIHRAPLT